MKKIPHKFHERISRSVVKAFTFRLLIIISDTFFLLILTQRFDIIVKLLTISTFLHTIIYILHERFWNRIHWGKKHTK